MDDEDLKRLKPKGWPELDAILQEAWAAQGGFKTYEVDLKITVRWRDDRPPTERDIAIALKDHACELMDAEIVGGVRVVGP